MRRVQCAFECTSGSTRCALGEVHLRVHDSKHTVCVQGEVHLQVHWLTHTVCAQFEVHV